MEGNVIAKETAKKVFIILFSVLVAFGVFLSIMAFVLYRSTDATGRTLPWLIAAIAVTSLLLIVDSVFVFRSKQRKKMGLLFGASMGLSLGFVLCLVPILSLTKVPNDPPAWVMLGSGVVLLGLGIGFLVFLRKGSADTRK